MFYFALAATLWRTASKYWNNVYHYEECWLAAVSCMCVRDFQLFRWWIVNTLSKHFCWVVERVDGTLWSWVMNSRDVIPSITLDWWTIYVCEFSVTGWTPSSRHFYCLRSELLLLQLILMEHFSSSIHHLPHLQPGQRTLIISSFVPPKTSTSRLQLKICIVFESTSTNCTTLRTITVNHLQYRYYDSTLRYVTTHLSQRTS